MARHIQEACDLVVSVDVLDTRRGAFGVNEAARTRRHSHQTSRLVSDSVF